MNYLFITNPTLTPSPTSKHLSRYWIELQTKESKSNRIVRFLTIPSPIPVPKKSPVSCFNDHHPIAFTPTIMKYFERLILRHIKNLLPLTLDPLQFAYQTNHSTDDAITTTLHLALTHLDKKDTCVRMLFIDFSSAFNTMIPSSWQGS